MQVSRVMDFQFLCTFGKFGKPSISFVMAVSVSVCLSVCPIRMEQLGSHWTDFRETSYLRIFRIPVE
jgi:hypothetical protein